MALKIRKGDTVAGDRRQGLGQAGRVLRVEPEENRLYVEGLNIVKRHQRPRSLKDTQRGGKVGGVIEKEGPIHVSNVMLVDPKREQADARRDRARRPTAARAVAKRSSTKLVKLMAAGSRSVTRARSSRADRAFGYTSSMQAPRSRRSRSTWASARRSRTPHARRGLEQLGVIAGQRRPSAARGSRSRLQAPPGHARRGQGHASA
jgi:large subunit ribosomal protein L24